MAEIEVEGLDDTIRFLSRLPAVIEKAADAAAKDAAGDEVPRIRSRAGQVGRREALAARSVRSSPDGIVAAAGGGTPAAIFYGAEFGGGGRPRTRQFAPYNQGGYFLYPQLRDDEALMADRVFDALEPIMIDWER